MAPSSLQDSPEPWDAGGVLDGAAAKLELPADGPACWVVDEKGVKKGADDADEDEDAVDEESGVAKLLLLLLLLVVVVEADELLLEGASLDSLLEKLSGTNEVVPEPPPLEELVAKTGPPSPRKSAEPLHS